MFGTPVYCVTKNSFKLGSMKVRDALMNLTSKSNGEGHGFQTDTKFNWERKIARRNFSSSSNIIQNLFTSILIICLENYANISRNLSINTLIYSQISLAYQTVNKVIKNRSLESNYRWFSTQLNMKPV